MLLLILVVLQLCLGTFSFVIKEDQAMEIMANNSVSRIFQDYLQDRQNNAKERKIDLIQQTFRCCGIYNGTETYGDDIPISCYSGTSKKHKIFTTGCSTAFQEKMMHYITLVGYMSMVFVFIEAAGVGLAYVMMSTT